MFALTPYRGAPGTSQPKTFSRQGGLPRLPIPQIDATTERYLKSIEPILLQKEEFGELKGSSAKEEMDKRREWAKELAQEGAVGTRLQHRLVDVDRTTPNNWLDDRYWLVKAYHEWRVPLLINSNWWLMFRADPGSPLAKLEDTTGQQKQPEDCDVAGLEGVGLGKQQWDQAQWGVRRATWLISRFLQFKRRLDDEDIMPDASRAGAFCMHQYTRLFGITRIPALPHDWNTEPPHPTTAKHVTVAVRDNFYSLEVLNDDGSIKELDDIEKALWDIVNDAKQSDGAGVGVLTSDDRDTWAVAREQLILSSPATNAASLRSIEDSLFVVSLDSSNLGTPTNHPPPPHQASPMSTDAHARNTSGAGRSGHNRWFDKALTISVEPNGRAGIMGEHSPCDALIPSIVADFAAAEPCPAPGSPFPAIAGRNEQGGSVPTWKKLEWKINESTTASIASAESKAKELASNSDIRMLWFDEYGAEWMKKIGKQSPDAFIQQALQLAYAKIAGRQTATYETASTRLYKHGRTDVIRSFSRESYDFVKAVRDGKGSKEVYELLSKATAAHNAQTRASSTGAGIDRHLTGMRLVYNPSVDGENNMPSLLTDPLFAESQTWKLSTSGLSAGDRFAGTGFGCGYEDGYGINYLAGASLLKFGIESKHSGKQTSTTEFAKEVVEALRFMREVCEKEAPKDEGAAKGKL